MISIKDTIIFKHKYIYDNYIIVLNYNKPWNEIVMILIQGNHYDIKFGRIMNENNRLYIAKFMVNYPEIIDSHYQILSNLNSVNPTQQNFILTLIQKYRT